jgi:hypothetical protein
MSQWVSPITPSALLFSIEAGWRADLVLRVAVSSINGIASNGPDSARFDRVVSLVRALQVAQALGMRVQPEEGNQETVVLFFRPRTLAPEQEAILKDCRISFGLIRTAANSP